MGPDAKEARAAQIADAAYEILSDKGFGGLSMLAVAKRAKASNETLYRWYGDKTGLFRALIQRNAGLVEERLDAGGYADLTELGEALLAMLLSPRAVALNRAAAADASDQLGAALAQEGRGRVFPKVASEVGRLAPGVSVDLWFGLLVGDWQIRCATGAMPLPDEAARRVRAVSAADLAERLAE
ncbi:TetR/AcrR family transcriptional regulator [Tropicibacter naphthalenivorans]|uniref:Transcriptional repressor BetI n=1 Tax=Tropicibacter naphthalenivorans TaxID=441103 RepID=A0A0P1G391_9RHOB|nr:TetR/AcrR family transcriptional regulator [Tropicibacter naphthalenivorans]CUH76116.1 transcriptional repressor BetI [Tropicibacter naphthalenivorans]SMC39958.1 transcriptional regulator, TetR family [Tropicibacter naphthalenivorans]